MGSWGTAQVGAEAPTPQWESLGVGDDKPTARDEPTADATLDQEEGDERPSHPYTGRQLLVLVVVAFVLGFLIVLLASRGSDSSSTPATTPAAAAQIHERTGTHLVV